MVKKNTVVVISCLIMSSIFIVGTIPSICAGAVNNENVGTVLVEDPCVLCRQTVVDPVNSPGCDTCKEAVSFAVDYMVEYVNDNVNDTYFLWSVDAVILISKGLIEGFRESRFDLLIDEDKLNETIKYYINAIVGSKKFTVTTFLAQLAAITIGVTKYLLTLCIEDNARNDRSVVRNIGSISWLRSRSTLWIILKHLLGLAY